MPRPPARSRDSRRSNPASGAPAQPHAAVGRGAKAPLDQSPQEPSPPTSTAAGPRDRTKLVLAAWVGLTLVLFGMVAFFGPQHPQADDWQNVFVLGGPMPSWHDLCTPLAQHRVPLLRLVLRWLALASHYNWQLPMFLSVVLLSILTLLTIGLLRRLRERLTLSDLVIPLLCLSPGHYENFLEGWNLQNVMFAFFAGLCLLILIQQPNWRFGQELLLLVLLTLLPWVSGGAGAILALGLTATLIVQTLVRLMARFHREVPTGAIQPGPSRRAPAALRDVATLLLAALSLLCTWANLAGLQTEAVERAAPRAIAMNTAELLAGPVTGKVPVLNYPVVWVVTLLLLIAASLAYVHLVRRDGLCDRSWLLGAFLGCSVLSAVAIAWARSGIDPDFCQRSRYTTVFLPFALAVYLLLALTETDWSRIAQRTILACVLIAIPFKTHKAIEDGMVIFQRSVEVERDAHEGKTGLQIVRRNGWLVPWWKPGEAHPNMILWVAKNIDMLRAHKIPPFDGRDAPPADQSAPK